jgi:DNA-binding MarR family transcriptional regulator
VRRTPNKNDRRIVEIELTAKGRAQAHKASEIRSAIGRKLDERLTRAERKQLCALIQKIVDQPKRPTKSE